MVAECSSERGRNPFGCRWLGYPPTFYSNQRHAITLFVVALGSVLAFGPTLP